MGGRERGREGERVMERESQCQRHSTQHPHSIYTAHTHSTHTHSIHTPLEVGVCRATRRLSVN